MAFKDRKNRNRDKKMSSYPRIWLNVRRKYHSLTFAPICPKLPESQFKKLKAQGKMPVTFSIPILMKDVKNVLFETDKAIYMETKVAKFLILHEGFRKSLLKAIDACVTSIEEYNKKLDKARIKRSKQHWKKRIQESEDKLDMLKDLKASLLNAI